MSFYLLQVFLALDQFFNTLFGGYADETLSSRAHRMREKKQRYWWWVAGAIDTLFFWQKDHCKHAWLSEVNRKQLDPVFSRLID